MRAALIGLMLSLTIAGSGAGQRSAQAAAGVPAEANPRTGPYARLRAEGRDLHELHALMAPRPFLVSGGSYEQLPGNQPAVGGPDLVP